MFSDCSWSGTVLLGMITLRACWHLCIALSDKIIWEHMGTENFDSDSEYGRCVDIVLWSQMAPLFGANWCICWSCADYWEGRRSVFFFQMWPLFSRKACLNSTLYLLIELNTTEEQYHNFFLILLIFSCSRLHPHACCFRSMEPRRPIWWISSGSIMSKHWPAVSGRPWM